MTDRPPTKATMGITVMRSYRREWLKGDVPAALTIGALLITQCMAYAPLAGLPPEAAFHAVIVALPVYALFGTSRHLVVGPDPGTAAVAGTGLASVAAVGTVAHVEAAAALGLMVGVVLVVAGLMRFGFVAALLSRPTLIGYLTGLGVTLMVGQVTKLTGIPITAERFGEKVVDIVRHAGEADGATAAMGLGTLALILVVRQWRPRWPAAVVGIVLATATTAAFSLGDHGVGLVGTIDAGVGWPSWPGMPLHDWGALVPTALAVALLGYADSFLTAQGVAVKEEYRLDADRELTGLGAANLAAGAFQGMPVASTGSGTAAASAAGGVTQLTFLGAAGFVLAAMLFASGVIARIPSAALAAVVVAAALGLIEVAGFRSLWHENRHEFVLALVTFAAVCVFDVLAGIIISIGLGLVLALTRMARPHDGVLGGVDDLDGWVDANLYEGATTLPGLLVYRFDAPLFFVNAMWFVARVTKMVEDTPDRERWLVLDFEGVGSIDTTATEALRQLVDDLEEVAELEVLAIARANGAVLGQLDRSGMVQPGGPFRVYPTINAAVKAYRAAR